MIPIVIGAIMLFNNVTGSQSAAAQASVATSAPSVEEYVRLMYAQEPILAEIAKCESRFRQYDEKGLLLRGEAVAADIGIMQINERFHMTTSQKLGYDIKTMQGNLDYAQYLFDKQGTQPWNASRKCWEKSEAAKQLAARN